MIDYHIHLERGPYTLDWLKKFWNQAHLWLQQILHF